MRVAWSNFQVVRVWGLLGHVANMARISPVANRRLMRINHLSLNYDVVRGSKPITSRLIREPFGLDDLLREQESLGDALVGVHVAYFELDREIACAAASRMRASMPMRSQGRCAWRSHKARCYP